jgi:hypothetical protein
MFDLMFDSYIATLRSRSINEKAVFIDDLPGLYAGPQPKINQRVKLTDVTCVNNITYYRVEGYSGWFYATRFVRKV